MVSCLCCGNPGIEQCYGCNNWLCNDCNAGDVLCMICTLADEQDKIKNKYNCILCSKKIKQWNNGISELNNKIEQLREYLME